MKYYPQKAQYQPISIMFETEQEWDDFVVLVENCCSAGMRSDYYSIRKFEEIINEVENSEE